jgi:hypothetical protein
MKRFDALITTQKTPALCKKMVIFEKWSFWAIFLDFFPKWDFTESWGFFAL